jgi:anti-sigma regulatory factor (Ser/Thr protein kinase)
MTHRFSHTMRNEVGELATSLRALEESAVYQQLPPSLRFVTELVLDELVSNTIKYGGPGEHEIAIAVDWDGEELAIRIEDDALPFNPWEQSAMGDFDEEDPEMSAEEIQELKIGGRGLQMLLRATDTRLYERTGGKNIVTVTRHLRSRAAA